MRSVIPLNGLTLTYVFANFGDANSAQHLYNNAQKYDMMYCNVSQRLEAYNCLLKAQCWHNTNARNSL